MDVRDVAQAHLLAMMHPSLAGFNGRHLMSTQSMWFSEIIQALRARRSDLGIGRIKTRKIGKLGIYFAALVINQRLKELLPFIDQKIELRTSDELVQAFSGIDYHPVEDSLYDMAESLLRFEKE